MRISNLLKTLGSGLALYVVMAACGSSDSGPSAIADGGIDGAGDVIDAMLDELGNPVKDAKADPLPPDIATELCDKTLTYNGGAATYRAAIHAYPGKMVNDLSAIRFVVRTTPEASLISDSVGPFRETVGAGAYVRDGLVAVNCGGTTTPATVESVTFILPR